MNQLDASDEHFFDDKLRHPSGLVRPLFYPPQQGVIDPRCLGIGAHNDYEVLYIVSLIDETPQLMYIVLVGNHPSTRRRPSTTDPRRSRTMGRGARNTWHTRM